jgi:hypothetical protein
VKDSHNQAICISVKTTYQYLVQSLHLIGILAFIKIKSIKPKLNLAIGFALELYLAGSVTKK